MDDHEAFELVRAAVIRAKREAVTLAPSQVTSATLLTEPPVYLDSLEFVAMITYLEDDLGLVADDDRFSPRSMRTVGDVVAGVQGWVADEVATG